MANHSSERSQLYPLSGVQDAIQPIGDGNWFEYPVTAYPHHTDYSGNVWHGAYLTWLEEARVAALRRVGVDFASLVALGCDLPVVELAIRYHQPIPMGVQAIVRTRMTDITGVRINWDNQIRSGDGQEVYLTARVVLVAIDREKGKIMRQLPSSVKDALAKLVDTKIGG